MAHNEIRLALYARVSTEAQEEEGQSLETQISMMREASSRMNASIAKVYRIQESAMPGSERQSLTAMLRDASNGLFDAVMVVKMDRLARSIEVLRHIEAKLSAFGVLLYEGAEEQNLRSAEGRLNRGIQALIGEYSVNRLKWSAAASRLERARRGWPHSGMLPFGRVVVHSKDRRNQDAVWSLDKQKSELALDMYRLYVDEGLNLAQVGKRVGMQPETLRRILTDQSGPIWSREFTDPATGERVQVHTQIPPLLAPEQIARVKERARLNQIERNGWDTRCRDYPLSQYIRCSNPECGWSNLSGHQTTDKRSAIKNPSLTPRTYAYYLHLPRARKDAEGKVIHACVHSVPAEQMEEEVFSRLGQLLANASSLEAAVRSALCGDPNESEKLNEEFKRLSSEQKKAKRTLQNAMDVLIEQRGTEAAKIVTAKVDALNGALASIEGRLSEVSNALKVARLPADFPERFSVTINRLVGLHGHMPMFWPSKAKRALLSFFFGAKSTRFDRAGKHERSNDRGIFVERVVEQSGEAFIRYTAKGLIGDFTGALTQVVETYDAEMGDALKREFSREEITSLASLANQLEGFLRFRSYPPVLTRWPAPACRETAPPGRSGGSGCPGTSPRRSRVAVRPAAAAGSRAPPAGFRRWFAPPASGPGHAGRVPARRSPRPAWRAPGP